MLRATRKIKAGERMLWCYGDEYAGNKLRQSCICNSCDSGLAAGKHWLLEQKWRINVKQLEVKCPYSAASLTLAPLQPPPTLDMPWEGVPSMSQHAPNMQLAPITTRAVLISLALRSDVAGMVIAPEPFDDVDEAYRLGRQFVLGRQEQSVELLVIPESANQVCRLLNTSVIDAFENMHPVVLLLKRRVRDDKPLVLLIDAPLPDDSKRRYANCLVFVEAVGQTYIMWCYCCAADIYASTFFCHFWTY
ncbi:hypothetical protein ANCCAN_11365 [Ancylostoma caninum]|uniref:SET domain-containing protein n=1 Tax=Ancylostoma caninum TaxID=29170 RepID=A0A368GE18_ANCCA|nr:hypothetical protein ANCCAN_11365 [Ancylostoma caninum]